MSSLHDVGLTPRPQTGRVVDLDVHPGVDVHGQSDDQPAVQLPVVTDEANVFAGHHELGPVVDLLGRKNNHSRGTVSGHVIHSPEEGPWPKIRGEKTTCLFDCLIPCFYLYYVYL